MKSLKKLGKLKLQPGKILRQEELLNFRGGSGSATCPDLTADQVVQCVDDCWVECGGGGNCFDLCYFCCEGQYCGEVCA